MAATEESGDATGQDVPRIAVIAIAMLGLTAGICVGWSRVGIAGTLVGGVLGALGGAGAFFLTEKEGAKQFRLTTRQLAQTAWSTIWFCLLFLIGCGVGVELRTHRFVKSFLPEATEVKLVALESKEHELTPESMAWLAIVQARLAEQGIGVESNNSVVKAFLARGPGENEQMLTPDAAKAIRKALSDGQALAVRLQQIRIQRENNIADGATRLTRRFLDRVTSEDIQKLTSLSDPRQVGGHLDAVKSAIEADFQSAISELDVELVKHLRELAEDAGELRESYPKDETSVSVSNTNLEEFQAKLEFWKEVARVWGNLQNPSTGETRPYENQALEDLIYADLSALLNGLPAFEQSRDHSLSILAATLLRVDASKKSPNRTATEADEEDDEQPGGGKGGLAGRGWRPSQLSEGQHTHLQ